MLSVAAACRTTATVSKETLENMLSAIRTEVDPAFVYAYENTKFVPPPGKTLLIVGQSEERIDAYVDAFGDEPMPAGWSAYWGVPAFRGITESHRSEVGASQNHQMLVDRFDDSVVHSAMWMVGTWEVARKTADGEYDGVIREYAAWARSIDRPLYLRIGYEFDGPHNALDPEVYVRAYRRVVDLLGAEGTTNIAYVWHSYAAPPYRGLPVSAWWPGDDYVDWVGISVFGHVYAGPKLGAAGDAVLAFARDKKKPVMIAESSPVHGIDPDDPRVWNDWFVNLFTLVYRNDIKAVAFIHEDWRSMNIEGLPADWVDARLTNNAAVAAAWFAETSRERWLHASPRLYEQLGYRGNTPPKEP